MKKTGVPLLLAFGVFITLVFAAISAHRSSAEDRALQKENDPHLLAQLEGLPMDCRLVKILMRDGTVSEGPFTAFFPLNTKEIRDLKYYCKKHTHADWASRSAVQQSYLQKKRHEATMRENQKDNVK